MPFFAFIGYDGPRGGELRPEHRPAHIEGLKGLAAADRIRHAGPLIGEEGTPIGSLIVFEADDLEAARAIAEGDPYVTRGIFDRWELHETRVVFP
ncbi:MAG: YciI family protein [Gaiellales bacterium]